MKVIRDAVHGDIELSPNEMRLIHTPGFQRLHGCRQLGLTHLVYPSAKHSRFEHVLGVMHVATEIAGNLRWLGPIELAAENELKEKTNGKPIAKHGGETKLYFGGPRERLLKVLRLAALLHDMGHVPYGHTFEDEMPIIPKHDEPSGRMDAEVSQALQQSGNQELCEEVRQTLLAISKSNKDEELYKLVEDGKIRRDLLVLADIIGNTICADLLDYIRRDHLMTGVRATYDNRILRYFAVGKHPWGEKVYDRVLIRLVKHGRVRGDCLADLLDLLKLRYNLSDKVLFHPKKCAASAMLIRAVDELGLSDSDLLKTSDDGLLEKHREHPLVDMIRKRELFKPIYVSRLEHVTSFDESRDKRKLLSELRGNHQPGSRKLRRRIEETVESNLGLPPHTVLIYCPKPDMTLKPIRVLVQWKDGTTRRLNELERDDDPLTFEQVSVLERLHPALWRLYLFVNPQYRNGGKRIRDEFCRILKAEAGITAACDPAFDRYLDTGAPDYMLGKQLDGLLEDTLEYQELPARNKSVVWGRCHADKRLASMAGDDEFEDLDVEILASRINDPGMRRQLEEIIDSALDETKPST